MKKFTAVLLSVLLIAALSLTASAYEYDEGGRTALINDLAELIPEEDEKTLNSKLEEISEGYELEISVLTVTSTDGKDITAFADDYYDYNGFGFGKNDDGIMLVLDMENREFATTTHGTAIEIFTDYDLLRLEAEFVPYLSQGSYTDAFIAFYEGCANIIDGNGMLSGSDGSDIALFPTDDGIVFVPDDETEDIYYEEYIYDSDPYGIFSLKWIAVSVVIGIIIAFLYTGYLKSQLKTVKRKPSASDYVVNGSFNVTQQQDVYLYSNTKRTPKAKNNGTSGRGGSSFGGGSSTHRSSSGRTHGGSRGSF